MYDVTKGRNNGEETYSLIRLQFFFKTASITRLFKKALMYAEFLLYASCQRYTKHMNYIHQRRRRHSVYESAQINVSGKESELSIMNKTSL